MTITDQQKFAINKLDLDEVIDDQDIPSFKK